MCQRRAAGEPVAYLTGHKEFYGLSLQVDARVLDPRPDTETLVDWALEVAAPLSAPRLLDLGTGSGANPPYIAATDPHLAALRHEPLQALASGADGLDDIRRIVVQAPAHLRPGGWLLLEHGWDQASAVHALLAAAGLKQVQSRKDLAGIGRCSGGQWPRVK